MHAPQIAAFVLAAVLALPAAAVAQTPQLVPPAAAVCEALAVKMRKAVRLPFVTADIDFTDPISGWRGRACRIAGSGKGLAYTSLEAALAAIQKPFADWRLDKSRTATSPNGEMKSFKKDDLIAVVSAEWNPPPGACPAGEPVADCTVKPARKVWSVTVDLIERAR